MCIRDRTASVSSPRRFSEKGMAMKLSVEFPSVSYREGPEAVRRLAQAIERIGYDHIDIFDHVVMGHPMEGRPPGPYNAAMPIIEALMGLSYIAAVTSRVTLGLSLIHI